MSGGGWAGVDELLPTLSVYNRDFDSFDATWLSYDWGAGSQPVADIVAFRGCGPRHRFCTLGGHRF